MSFSSSALRAVATLDPQAQIHALRTLFADLPAHAHEEASAIAAALPRLIHHLALAGALTGPAAQGSDSETASSAAA